MVTTTGDDKQMIDTGDHGFEDVDGLAVEGVQHNGDKDNSAEPVLQALKENAKKASNPKGTMKKRVKENSLTIKNVPPEANNEANLLSIFQPFDAETKSNILGIKCIGKRRLSFVDFDSIAPITAVLNHHAQRPLTLLGQVLEVDQRSQEFERHKGRQRKQHEEKKKKGTDPGKVIWPWSKEEEAVWAKDIVQKYGEVTHLDRYLHYHLLGIEDVELAMRRRLGIEPIVPNADKGSSGLIPEKEGDLPSFFPAKSFQGSKPGHVFRLVKGTGLGHHRDELQANYDSQPQSQEITTNQSNNVTDPKLATLRKHRTESPALTHKQRLQALQKADHNLWGKVTFNNYKKLVTADNKLVREESTKLVGQTGYASTKNNRAAAANVIGRTGHAKVNLNANREKPIPTDYDSVRLPPQRLPGGAYPLQLCGRHLKKEKHKDNVVCCRSDGDTENKSLQWALDSDLYEPCRADVRQVQTLVICRHCDPPPPWGTGPPLTSQFTPKDYFNVVLDDYSSDDDGDYGTMGGLYGGGFRDDAAMFGFSEDDAYELLCQGVKPWDDDAADVLAVLNGEYY